MRSIRAAPRLRKCLRCEEFLYPPGQSARDEEQSKHHLVAELGVHSHVIITHFVVVVSVQLVYQQPSKADYWNL